MPSRSRLVVVAAACSALVLAFACRPPAAPDRTTAPPTTPRPVTLDARCGICHGVPGPELLPRDHWEVVLRKMANMIVDFNLGAPIPENELVEIIGYYTSNAPRKLQDVRIAIVPAAMHFVPSLPAPPPTPKPEGDAKPFIANVNVTDFDRDGRSDVLVCDAQGNVVTWMHEAAQGWTEEILGPVSGPAHSEPVDLEGDGDLDVVVAALGKLMPTDELVGQVVVLVDEGGRRFTPRTILQGVGRTVDAQPGDLDGDGDVDFVVAVFGGWIVGHVSWLEQVRKGEFVQHVVDPRNGAIHVPVIDLDADGDLDFIALISQRHEEVVAYLNDGNGAFELRSLWKAGHPLYGSSGLQLVDVDRDGDTDILYTNGDAHDLHTGPKPYHGIQWLENVGALRFEWHDVIRMHGAYGGVATDLDADGDVDIVATSQINDWTRRDPEALAWMENDGHQRFVAHVIAHFPYQLVTADVGDLDRDGRLDIVTGAMNLYPTPTHSHTRLTVWLQQPGPAPPFALPGMRQ